MFKNICVPLDGSELSETSLAIARELAGREKACIHLLEVVQPPWPDRRGASPASIALDIQHQLDASRAYLLRHAAALKEQGIQTHVAAVEALNVADAVLAYCEKNHVDLITMATHGRGGIGRVLLGSVTDRVVQHSRVPVLVNRPAQQQTRT
jgi:nucleotide-binding universal stress UspA family protein